MDGVFEAGDLLVREVAIAINEPRENQRHIGLLFEDSDSESFIILHLAFHLDLKLESPPLEGLWIDPAFPEERLRHVSAIARRVWKRNEGRIPFGFSRPTDCFDSETYDYLVGPNQHGLTCATFVLAIFLAAGLDIVKYDTWPHREEDAQWQNSILAPLQTRGSSEHIATVKSNVGSVRVRPEEVAAAATLSPLPVDFPQTEPAAAELLRLLKLAS